MGFNAVDIPCLLRIHWTTSETSFTNDIIAIIFFYPSLFSLASCLSFAFSAFNSLLSMLLLTYLNDHSGYPQRASAVSTCLISSSLSDSSAIILLLLSYIVLITLNLWGRGLCESKLRYRSVWVFFQYPLTFKTPSFLVIQPSRKRKDFSTSGSSVNVMLLWDQYYLAGW